MRPLEIVLTGINAMALCTLMVPRLRRASWTRYIFFAVAFAVLAQVFFEGPRWQMAPGYALSVVFFGAGMWRLFRPQREKQAHKIAVRMLFWAASVLGILIFAISFVLPVLFPVFHFAKPTGSYQIGTISYHWVDTSRHELFSTNPGARRELMAQVWYPVSGDKSSKRAPYVTGAGAISAGATHALSSGGLVRLPSFFLDHFKYVKTHAIPSAPVSATKHAYPVAIYLTGLDGFRQVSTFQIENLASHGYIVVGIDQPYTVAAVTFPDGKVIQGLTKDQVQPLIDQSLSPAAVTPQLNGQPLAPGIIPYLAQDVSFTLNQLTAINTHDPDDILTGRLDLQHVGAFGVSLGAMVAAQACHDDQRLKACLMMDAAMPADVVRDGLSQPSMWMTRDAASMRLERQRSGGWSEQEINQTLGTMQATYAKSKPGAGYYVSIPGMFHVNFTDTPYWSPFTAQLGLTGPINSQRGFTVVNAYTTAFFDQTLMGQPSALLDGSSQNYPEAHIQVR